MSSEKGGSDEERKKDDVVLPECRKSRGTDRRETVPSNRSRPRGLIRSRARLPEGVERESRQTLPREGGKDDVGTVTR